MYLTLWQPLSDKFVITNTLTNICVHSVSVILKLHGLTIVYFRLFSCDLTYIEKFYREKACVCHALNFRNGVRNLVPGIALSTPDGRFCCCGNFKVNSSMA